jgi:serine/threonine-protein kinase RsbW
MSALHGGDEGRAAPVQLAVPADPAYVSVIRTVVASLAARGVFTLDEIDDLRIAVDEASSLLLPFAAQDSQLRAAFYTDRDQLSVRVTVSPVSVTDAAGPDQTSLGWLVLAALTDEVTVTTEPASGLITLTLSRSRGARI